MSNQKNEATVPSELRWLADAPLFIDAEQIGRFHDAIVQPEHSEGSTSLEIGKESTKNFTVEAGGEAAAELSTEITIEPNALLNALCSVFPFLKGSAKASAKGGVKGQLGGKHMSENLDSQKRIIELHSIHTPQRQLVHLALHYFANLRNRVQTVNTDAFPNTENWLSDNFISELPRSLFFIDVPAGVPILPMAAEFKNGAIEKLYPEVGDRAFLKAKNSPDLLRSVLSKYKSARQVDSKAGQAIQEREKFALATNEELYDSWMAMDVIEQASAKHGGGIRWIDYRLVLNEKGEEMHLHAVPAGVFDTGVFAYNFVQRGFSVGLRLVGTMRKGAALNVLAVYEK
ncbi:hypothetical protein [Blastopirellula marina]|uniref:Uncharacterized protein n=1 Tax=Blastopirellula marina DSM 3645 TaxID=314230 RepID=A3ZSB2_9BACT|nr:hypothetical protein [Blastopirellula marina]EAQ80572.1 hypothetical protein DSM3645_14540 [Blastopirellula marina DSM 3645]